jgi:hypothetical protein
MTTRKIALLSILLTASIFVMGQPADSLQSFSNTIATMMNSDSKLTIGGYAQIDYNQPLNSETYENGNLDVHRLVMLFGYKFNERTQFFTELEFEHVSEVYVEQAFLNYTINDYMDFRGGLLLVPMGIINEYHEPPTFNGVERPHIDNVIAPTTWREIGFGFTGNITNAQMKYQVYLINGFNGYDGAAKLNGKDGLRKGRQKGAESYISSPNATAKVEYYGFRGLNMGLSGYVGKTQSTLYDGLSKDDEAAKASADSSVVGIAMLGLDARYQLKGFQAKGQLYYNKLSNTDQYNAFTGGNNLGSAMIGYYIETGYNVFRLMPNQKSELVPFIRYEQYNTHSAVDNSITANDAYNVNIITAGLGWKITPKAALKADMQFVKSAAADKTSKVFNAGIGIMF